MHELKVLEHKYPARYWQFVVEDMEANLGGYPNGSVLPTVIVNVSKAFELENYLPRFESLEVRSFGFYLAVHWLDHSFEGADVDPHDRLPEPLLEVLRRKLLPDVQNMSLEAFEATLDGLTYAGLSSALYDWHDLHDTTIIGWGDNGEAVVNIYYEQWHDHCAEIRHYLDAIGVSFLDVYTGALDYDEGASYERWAYDQYLERLDAEDVKVLPYELILDFEEEAAIDYRHPLKGGGFTCMN